MISKIKNKISKINETISELAFKKETACKLDFNFEIIQIDFEIELLVWQRNFLQELLEFDKQEKENKLN